MNWIKIIDINAVPQNKPMLFADGNNWFEGRLIDDSEYGLVVSIEETYFPAEKITNYMIVELP